MKRIHSTVVTSAIILTCCALFGCASTSKKAPSGFLKNYPQFQPGPTDGVDQIYTKQGMDLSRYRRVMLDEAQFYLKKSAADQGIQASELKELSDSFHRAIFEALGNAYPLITEPDVDVLRIRLAITDIETSNPAMSGVTTVLPIGLAVSVAKKAATGSYTGVGLSLIHI